LKNVKEGDKIEITSSKFTNERKELEDGTKKSFFRFIIFEAKIQGDGNQENAATAPAAPEKPKAETKPANKPVTKEEDPF